MAASTPQKGEAWASQNVMIEGGLYLDKDVLFQATQMPGSARTLINFEPSLDGGYHRILGYSLFDTHQLPNGSSQVFGTVVSPFESSVIAMQSGNTYRSTGAGWTKINGADTHAAMSKVQYTKYTWSTNRFAFVDGDPNAFPVRIEASGAYTVLSNAPMGQKFIQEFQQYLWMSAGDGNLTFSAPGDDTNYNAINGAGQINVGFSITGIGVWRGALYVFGEYRIAQITGTSAADWVVTLLTDNIGCTGVYSLQEVNGDLIFLSSDGLRTISGTARIFDRELGVISRNINTLLIPAGASNLTSVVIGTKSQYRLFQGTSSTTTGTFPCTVGALKLQSNGSAAWEWAQIEGIAVSCADNGLFNNVELVVHGAWDGYVYQQESGITFNGTPITATYTTPYLIFSDPNIRKILYKMCANIHSAGSTSMSLGVTFDYLTPGVSQPMSQTLNISGGGISWDDGPLWDASNPQYFWDSFPDSRVCANLIGSCFSAAFSFVSFGGNDYSIQSLTIQFGEGVRR